MDFFFLSLDFSYEHSENYIVFFLCPVRICRVMNAKKKLEIREGRQEQWKPTSIPWNFFFCFTTIFPMNIPYFFLYAVLVFLQ